MYTFMEHKIIIVTNIIPLILLSHAFQYKEMVNGYMLIGPTKFVWSCHPLTSKQVLLKPYQLSADQLQTHTTVSSLGYRCWNIMLNTQLHMY